MILLIPLIGAVLVYALGRTPKTAKYLALAISFVTFALAILLFFAFDPDASGYQFLENYSWIPQIGASYIVGVDGLSLALVILTPLLTTTAIIYSWTETKRPREFYAFLLLMNATVLGVFLSLDFFLFYIFWEVELVPMYFLIALWGGENRKYAAMKFFLYTQAASLLVLFGILALYFQAGLGTFNMIEITAASPGFSAAFQGMVFLCLFVGFGVKIPMVPFHTWLPDAHVQAPTAGSVLLAGVLLKMGGYGLLRVAVTILPGGLEEYYWLLAIIGVISIVYGAFLCLAQDDLKRLVAYSSVSHMGFVLLGIATMTEIGMAGAVFQMFAHGVISGALFMLCGSALHATGTRKISELGGIAKKMPIFAALTMAGFLASLGLPGMAGFIAEITVFMGTFEAFGWWILIPLISVALTAGYYLFAMQRAFFGPFNEKLGKLHDIHRYEIIPLAILIGVAILFGVFPSLFLDPINTWIGGLPIF